MSLFEECEALIAVRERAFALGSEIGSLTTDHAAKKVAAIDHREPPEKPRDFSPGRKGRTAAAVEHTLDR